MRTIFGYVVLMVLASFFGALLWLLFLFPVHRRIRARRGETTERLRETVIFLCFVYFVVLFALTLTPKGFWNAVLKGEIPAFPPMFRGEVNLIPIKQSLSLMRYYVRYKLWGAFWINFPGNIVIFIPLGMFYGLLSGKPKWWKNALVALGLSLFIECFQLIVSRGTDVDDLILNSLGGMMGYGLYCCLRRQAPELMLRCRGQKKGRL